MIIKFKELIEIRNWERTNLRENYDHKATNNEPLH